METFNTSTYNDKVHKILKLARDAEDPDELAALEHCLAAAQYYRFGNLRKAHRLLDNALGGDYVQK